MPKGVYIRTKEEIENRSKNMSGIKNPKYKPEIHIIHTLEDCIRDIGEIPFCQCEDTNGNNCGLKVNVKPEKYFKYLKEGYPKFLPGHSSKGKGNGMYNITSPMKGKSSSTKGIPRSPEVILKISNAQLGKLNHQYGKTKEFSSNWLGGVTTIYQTIRNSQKYSEWRTSIFERDNFTCQECHKTNCYLEAHHIKLFNLIIKENNITTFDQALQCEQLWDLSNGITLCKKCHDSKHKELNL